MFKVLIMVGWLVDRLVGSSKARDFPKQEAVVGALLYYIYVLLLFIKNHFFVIDRDENASFFFVQKYDASSLVEQQTDASSR